jgi:hypothetical protein
MRFVPCVSSRHELRQVFVGRIPEFTASRRGQAEFASLRWPVASSSGPRAVLRNVMLALRSNRSASILERMSWRITAGRKQVAYFC